MDVLNENALRIMNFLSTFQVRNELSLETMSMPATEQHYRSKVQALALNHQKNWTNKTKYKLYIYICIYPFFPELVCMYHSSFGGILEGAPKSHLLKNLLSVSC